MDEPAKTITGARDCDVRPRTGRPQVWTKARRDVFLDRLAATSNVTLSAQHAGVAPGSAYALRRRDPAFAQAWSAALADGYERLEAELMARAIGPDADATRSDDPPEIPFDAEMAFRILAQRKGGAGTGRPRAPAPVKRVTVDQVTASLRRKLDAIARRAEKA